MADQNQSSKTILVVEDDDFLRTAITFKLEKMGYVVEAVNNGEVALQKLATRTPDIILLDVMMPVKNGFVVLEEIKKNPTLQSIPVLMLTNLSQPEDREKAVQLGAVGYIVKSESSLNVIIQKIEDVLSTTTPQPAV